MAGYGYTQPKFGASQAPKVKPLQPARGLASAAAGTPTVGDPFGLLGRSPSAPMIDGTTAAPAKPQAAATQAPVAQAPPAAQPAAQPAAAPQQSVYDINTDPALQAVNAYTGLSDEQARGQAQQQMRDTILNSGFEELARKVFAGDENLAKAAASNPTSTKAQLTHQKDLSQKDLLDALNAPGHNLGYSGYRVSQEGELGRQYEDALAQAAAGTNSQLDQIGGGLASLLQGNRQQRAGALGDASSRAIQYALANPPVGGDAGGLGGDGAGDPLRTGGLFGAQPYEEDPLKALMLAASLRTRSVAN